jgi:hypothetical protein
MVMHTPQIWGVSPEEVRTDRPCDGLLEHEDHCLYRGVSVAAPKQTVFRWLCQLRVAPYSYDWIDNGGRTSPRTLTPGLEELAVGQEVMSIFTLERFERDQHLTMRLSKPGAKRLFGDLVCTYAIESGTADGQTRLIVKMIVDNSVPPSLLGRAMRWFLPWGDLIMMRKQLLTLKKLAERDARQN